MSTTERRIGRYLLLEPVGRGAMGIVYRAEDPSIHRTVAVKVLHPDKQSTPSQVGVARERFRREAQAAGSIDHPNIIRILDVGEEDGGDGMFIVMEYLSGPSLAEMIDGADVGLDRAVEIIGQIAAGLDAAHEGGLVHRDVKPSNILFTGGGTAKIADFGITQVASSSLTQDLTKLGTPAYMSPEQVNGRLIDRRADLFSLGVLSYEILTGRRPFAGADAVSIAFAIAHAEPAPASHANPQLPAALDAVLDRMLAKEAAARYESGRDFYEALVQALSVGAALRAPAPPRPARRRAMALWGLAAVSSVTAVVFLLLSARELDPASDPVPVPAPPVAKAPERPAAKAAVPPPAPARIPVPTTKVAVSLAHRVRVGTLVVSLDGRTILTKEFSKPRLAVSKTSTWGPVEVPTGRHKVKATVKGANGKTYVSEPTTIEIRRTQGLELRFTQKGDELTLQPPVSRPGS